MDTGLSELQMFVRAKMENEEERGERQGLSLLEQVFGLYKIRDSVSAEKLDGELKREFMVAEKLRRGEGQEALPDRGDDSLQVQAGPPRATLHHRERA